MSRSTLAGLCALLALSAACSPGRQPVASVPAPAPLPTDAPPPSPVETVTPVDEGLELRGAPAPVGADLLGNAQYDLPVVANEWVRMELEFLVYQRHEVVAGWLRQADRYDEWVRDVFASYGIPRDLHHLGMIESGYRPTVRSHAGAVGMWQFMPATGREMGLRIDSLVDERMDPVRATHAAARHLRALHRRFRGDWALAAAAYNAGEGRINRAMGRYGATDFWDVAARGNLAQETRRYVPRLFATTIIAKDPTRFGYPAPQPGRRFAYDSMRVDLATPLSVLALMGNVPVSDLVDLNPHLFRQIAPRNYWVWVPLGQGQPLQQAFTESEYRQRGGFATYRVREGESLARIAEVSGVPVERIRSMNLSANLDNLRPGDRVRLYADAVRVLDARPTERVARRNAPRVLGDPAPGAEAAASTSSSERRSASSSESSERRAASSASSERRTGTSERSGSSASSERRSGSSASSERRSGSASSSERRGGESSASSERRSGSGTSERSGSSASGERRSASASSTSSARRSEGGSAAGRTHTVEDGETLWGIARRFDTTVDAMRQANDLDEDDHIQPGQTLRIPRAASGSSTASGNARESGSRTASSASGSRESGNRTASSASGSRESGSRASSAASSRESGSRTSSTASSSSRESGSRGSSTASSGGSRESGNRASSSSSGERRASSEPAAGQRRSSEGSRPALSTVNRMPNRREHTVADGETLWGIARRYDTTVEAVRRANALDADDQIQPGQKLRIPED